MKLRINKLTAWVLTLAMLMTFIPSFTFTVFAADGDVASVTTADGATTNYYTSIFDAINKAQENECSTLKLLDDINTESTISVEWGKFTIDLNGKTWDLGDSYINLSDCNVIITDNSTEGTGRIVSTNVVIFLSGYSGNTKLEIAGGTLETQSNHYVVNTGINGETTIGEFILSGGKLVTAAWAAINVDCSRVTIKGGEIESLGDDHDYHSGLLDFSQHPDPTGVAVCFYMDKTRTPEAIRIKLPEGYCFYEYGDSEKVASGIEEWSTYTVGKVIEGKEPVCICPNECSQNGLNGSCNACLSDMSDCTGAVSEPVQNITLFFNNTQNWSEVYAYYWGSKKITPWPGMPMTHVGDGIWSVSVPADAVNIDIYDLADYTLTPGLTIPTDGSNYYNDGTWTTYICSHEKYDGGICTVCGLVCEHNTFEDDKCTVCGYVLEDMITGYDKTTKSAIVTVKEAGTYSLIFAKYSEGNRLDKVDVVEFDFVKGINTVSQKLIDFTLGTGDKIMLWKDMTNLVPLCEAYIVK